MRRQRDRHTSTRNPTILYTPCLYIYTSIPPSLYLYIYACVCVCVRARIPTYLPQVGPELLEHDLDGEFNDAIGHPVPPLEFLGHQARAVGLCVCVCVCVCVCMNELVILCVGVCVCVCVCE